jgi:hypothetical protein
VQLTAVNVAVEDCPGVTAVGLNAKPVISITAETGHADGAAAAASLAAVTASPPPTMITNAVSSALRNMASPFLMKLCG